MPYFVTRISKLSVVLLHQSVTSKTIEPSRMSRSLVITENIPPDTRYHLTYHILCTYRSELADLGR